MAVMYTEVYITYADTYYLTENNYDQDQYEKFVDLFRQIADLFDNDFYGVVKGTTCCATDLPVNSDQLSNLVFQLEQLPSMVKSVRIVRNQ